ncbi:DUF4290 domain-containing protein [Niabella soli]|uniref:Methionyl-tRNA formyltransferase n=1 Tax=Niabella soli DSM 19437 TaxID=929713 RepID=W0F367_9BACT|nr:DUF4290 domain-containing protein [Niabella soli]AHF15944.1 hypothetical protein NIASO_13815 [Niabella soli DSM 19437]
MEYNTTRNKLIIREYGRNVQKMVEYILTIEDPEKRKRNADSVIELMAILNPSLKTVEDYKHKLWDHLFQISDFQLDVSAPYPKPTPEELSARPDPLPYPTRSSKLAHLGSNLEALIERALQETDPEKKQGYANSIAYYMKLAYSNWHKEVVHDDAIQSELSDITDGQLTFTNTPSVKAFRPDNGGRDRDKGNFNNKRNKFQQRSGNNGNNNNNNRRNNNGGGFKKKRFL